MGIDWGLVANIAVPLATLLVGAILTRVLSRPVVTTYLGHVSAHRQAAVAEGPHFDVFTHSVVIQNNGWASAKNVRLTHNILPSFSVFPDVEYQVFDLPGGGRGCPGRCWNLAAARVRFYATCSTSVASPRPRR